MEFLEEEIYEKAKVNISVVVNDNIKNVIISNLKKNITDTNITINSYSYNNIHRINSFPDALQYTHRINKTPHVWIKKVKASTSVIIFCIDWQHIRNKRDEEQKDVEQNAKEYLFKREEIKQEEETKNEEANKSNEEQYKEREEILEERKKEEVEEKEKKEVEEGEAYVQNSTFMQEVNQELSSKINEIDEIIMKRKKVCKIILLVILPENTKNTELYIKHVTLLNSPHINAIFITLGLKEIHNKIKKLENLLKDCINHFFKQYLISYDRKSKKNLIAYFHYNFKKAYILEMLEKYDESMNIYVNLCKTFYENIGKENMSSIRLFFDYVILFNCISLRMISIYLYFKDIKKGMHHIYTHKKILFLSLMNKSFYHLYQVIPKDEMESLAIFKIASYANDFISYMTHFSFGSVMNNKISMFKEDRTVNEIIFSLYEQISREYLFHNLLACVYLYVYRLLKNMNTAIHDICLHGLYSCINMYNQITILNKMKKLVEEYENIKFENYFLIKDASYLYNFVLNILVQIFSSLRINRVSNLVVVNIYYLSLILYEMDNYLCSLFLLLQFFNHGDDCLFLNCIDEKLLKEGHCDLEELFSSLHIFEKKKNYLSYRNADHYGCLMRLLVNNLGILLNYELIEEAKIIPKQKGHEQAEAKTNTPVDIKSLTKEKYNISIYGKLFLQICFEYLNILIKANKRDRRKEKNLVDVEKKAEVEVTLRAETEKEKQHIQENRNEVKQFLEFMNKYFQLENKGLNFNIQFDVHIFNLYINLYYLIRKKKKKIHIFLNIKNKNEANFCVLPFIGVSLNKKMQLFQLSYNEHFQSNNFYFGEPIKDTCDGYYSFLFNYVKQNKELMDINSFSRIINGEENYETYMFSNEPNLINLTLSYDDEKKNEWTIDFAELFFYFYTKIIKVKVERFYSYRLKSEYLELQNVVKDNTIEAEKNCSLSEEACYMNTHSILENDDIQENILTKCALQKCDFNNTGKEKQIEVSGSITNKLFHIRDENDEQKTLFFNLKKNIYLNKSKNVIIFNRNKFLYKTLSMQNVSYYIFSNQNFLYLNEYNVSYLFVKYSKYIKQFEFMFSYDMNEDAENVDLYILTRKGNEFNMSLMKRKQSLTFVGNEQMFIWGKKRTLHSEKGKMCVEAEEKKRENKEREATEDTEEDTTEESTDAECTVQNEDANYEKGGSSNLEPIDPLENFTLGNAFLNLDATFSNETKKFENMKNKTAQQGEGKTEEEKTEEEKPQIFFFEIKEERESSKLEKLKKIYGKSNFCNECYILYKKIKNRRNKTSYFSFFKNKNEKLICIPFIINPKNAKYVNINFEVSFCSLYNQDSLQYHMKYAVEPSRLTFITKINRNTNGDAYDKRDRKKCIEAIDSIRNNDNTNDINKNKNGYDVDTEYRLQQYYLYIFNNNVTDIIIKSITNSKLRKEMKVKHKCTYCDLIETEQKNVIMKYHLNHEDFFFPFNKIFQKILFSHVINLPVTPVTKTRITKENSQQKEQKKSKIKIDVAYSKIVRFNEPFVVEAIITNETDITEEIFIFLYDKNKEYKNEEKLRLDMEKSTKKMAILKNKRVVEKKKSTSVTSSESSFHSFNSNDLDHLLSSNAFLNDSNEHNCKKEYIVTGTKIMKNILLPYQTIKLKWTFIPLVYGLITIPNVLIKRKTKIKSNINLFCSSNIHTFVI